jgi:hypothetical protein
VKLCGADLALDPSTGPPSVHSAEVWQSLWSACALVPPPAHLQWCMAEIMVLMQQGSWLGSKTLGQTGMPRVLGRLDPKHWAKPACHECLVG